jgi:uncharacterized membrane protein
MSIGIGKSATVTAGRGRLQALDVLRGLAIVAMVVFHFAWDLYYFGLSDVDVTSDPGWELFQKAIVSCFLLLVGAGLVLAHRDRIRWPAFWRRFAIILSAALLVTAGTYWMFPDYFVYFGVLHAIALFSLMALAFLRLPAQVILLAGMAVILGSFAWSSPDFEVRWLAWIGFWPEPPPTTDVVPIFPWFGVVLLGMAGMRGLLATQAAGWLQQWRSNSPPVRGLAFLGRWSLPVYLLHQPLMIAIFWAALQLNTPQLLSAG